jgi:hypothetical protein
MYRCEKCNLEMETFNWRLILSINIVDMTGNQWAQCFQEQGEDILGVKAQDLGDMFNSDKEAYDKVFEVSRILIALEYRLIRFNEYSLIPPSSCNTYYFILFYFILFYFILFYFILFYFILFYFILFYLLIAF